MDPSACTWDVPAIRRAAVLVKCIALAPLVLAFLIGTMAVRRPVAMLVVALVLEGAALHGRLTRSHAPVGGARHGDMHRG